MAAFLNYLRREVYEERRAAQHQLRRLAGNVELGEVLETLFGHDQKKLQFKLARTHSHQLVERLAGEVAVQVLVSLHFTGLHCTSRTSVQASSLFWLGCSTASRWR